MLSSMCLCFSEMGEEAVTYSEVRVHSSSQERRRAPDYPENKGIVGSEHRGV